MIIAGEASGDLHASYLIKALSRADSDARFVFLGGDRMASAAGHDPVVHNRDMAYMGFSEVLRHLPSIFSNLKKAKRALAEERPDALILVDYPSFNIKMAKAAKKLGIPCFWYISPKIWAWKQWRVKSIRRLVRRVLCILPFEPTWYADHAYNKAVYVGNPTVEELDQAMASAAPRSEFLSRNRLRDRNIIALLPGSRRGEIRCNLPIMDAVARQFPQYTIVVAGAPGVPDEFYSNLTKFAVVRDDTHTLLAHSYAALVTSGTATLEAAVASVPQVVLYRSNGSRLAYNLMKRLLHVKFVSLPNLIADREVVPEMLLHFCTVEAVTDRLREITPSGAPRRMAMLKDYADVYERLSGNAGYAAENAAGLIIENLTSETKETDA